MTKLEFLASLRAHLEQMPPEERERHLTYYEELFEDMLEDGMSESEIAEHLGEPAVIAEELLTELPLGTLVKSRVRPRDGWTVLNIALLVLGSPIWLPLLLTLAVVLLVLLLVLWILVLSFGIVVLALGLSVPSVIVGAILGYVSVAATLGVVGEALICGGLCILGVIALPPVFRGAAKLCAGLFRWIKSLFIRKES